MKKYLFPLILLTLLVLGCKKNEDITEIEVQTPEPIPLNEVALIGQVTDDNGTPLPGAEIAARYQSEIFADTESDEDGFYTFPPGSLPVEGVLLEVSKSQYFDNFKRVSERPEEPVDIAMMAVGNQGLAEAGLTTTDSMVLIQGEVVDQSGAPKEGVYVFLNTGNTFLGIDRTTVNGKFSILTAQGQAFTLQAAGVCQQQQIGPVDIPPVFNDTTLSTFAATFGDDSPVTIMGQALTCDGQPITNGRVEFKYFIGESARATYPIGSGGNFSFQFYRCGINTDAPVALEVYDEDNGKSGAVSFTYDGADEVDLGAIEACDEAGSFLRFTYQGQTYEPQPEAWREFVLNIPGMEMRSIGYSEGDQLCNLIFELSQETGSLQLQSFTYVNGESEISIYSEQNTGTVEVSAVSAARISGTFMTTTSIAGTPQEDFEITGEFSVAL